MVFERDELLMDALDAVATVDIGEAEVAVTGQKTVVEEAIGLVGERWGAADGAVGFDVTTE